jgi:hypothetical protein
MFIWKGTASVDGRTISAGDFGLDYCRDELLITHDKALEGFEIKNTGSEEVTLFSFFGPDINLDVPMLKKYGTK